MMDLLVYGFLKRTMLIICIPTLLEEDVMYKVKDTVE